MRKPVNPARRNSFLSSTAHQHTRHSREEPVECVGRHVDVAPGRPRQLVVDAAGRAVAARQRLGKSIPGVDVAAADKLVARLAVHVAVEVGLRGGRCWQGNVECMHMAR